MEVKVPHECQSEDGSVRWIVATYVLATSYGKMLRNKST